MNSCWNLCEMLCESVLLWDSWFTQLLHAVQLCLWKAFHGRIMKQKAAERPDAPIGRTDVNAKHGELQMIMHSLLFYRQWEWNPVSLRSTGWPSETKTWHQKSQVIAWLGTCGMYNCITVVVCRNTGRQRGMREDLHDNDTFKLSEYLLNTASRTVV